MGQCVGKEVGGDEKSAGDSSNHHGDGDDLNLTSGHQAGPARIEVRSSPSDYASEGLVPVDRRRRQKRQDSRSHLSRKEIDKLVLETLAVIRTLVDNSQEPPQSVARLHLIADLEDGWLEVVQSMVAVIPINDPLGPANMTLLLDDCPLPTKELVMRLLELLELENFTSKESKKAMDETRHRNIAIVLGCIAEKLAGPRSIGVFTKVTIDYLISNLTDEAPTAVILFSLIALEKFAQTSENKVSICKWLKSIEPSPGSKNPEASWEVINENNPFVRLERWTNQTDFMKRQVGFCAQWCLDNLFPVEGRPFSFEGSDMSAINVILNSNDVSEYLKIGPNGLLARCDASSFESVRSTFEVSSGVWYYEILIMTAGVMQVGWATKNSNFLNHEGYGIGDDEYSFAFDGCRQLLWSKAESISRKKYCDCWKPGDIVGSLLDLDKREITFSLNGKEIPTFNDVHILDGGYFAAASFMAYQQCEFNFGHKPFKYPPVNAKSLNQFATLEDEDKKVLPRLLKLEMLRNHSVKDNACILCYDEKANVELQPCGHQGFCSDCSRQISTCPICRADIKEVIPEEES